MNIHYAGIRAGGGKTFSYATIAIDRSSKGLNTVIISPSINLIKETETLIDSMIPHGRVVSFTSEDGHTDSVTKRAINYLDHDRQSGDILLLSHQCFFMLPYFKHKQDWRLLIDEEPKVFETFTLNLHNNHSIITDCIDITESNSTHSKIIAIDNTRLKSIVDNKNKDVVFSALRDVASAIIDEDRTCYVNATQYHELLHGLKPKTQLTIFTLRNYNQLQVFEGVTIASAWFEDSLTYHYWESLGASWIEDNEVLSHVIRNHHPYNTNLTIYYGYDGRYSKKRRDGLEAKDNYELWNKSLELMGKNEFLWLENNDRRDSSILGTVERGEPLPPVSAGLNMYSDYRNAVILYATNYRPNQATFLRSAVNFGPKKQDRAMVGNLYQAFMRTCLRRDEIDEETKWVVACREEAELLSERFPGSVVRDLGLQPIEKKKVGRPRKHENDNARKRHHDRKKKESSTLRVDFVQSLAPMAIERVVFLSEKDETSYKTIGHFVRQFRGSYFSNMEDTAPKVIARSEDQFIDFLKEMHTHTYQQKDNIPAITGALFDPAINNGGYRKKDYVLLCRGIWLDVEGGDLTVKDFERAFPQLWVVAYNTFSHTTTKPRYRIYLPTTRAMSEGESKAIYKEIRSVLKSQGWKQGQRAKAKLRVSVDDRFDGIDYRPGPSQLSLLPCQAKDRKASFFIQQTEGRKPLNVDAWLRQQNSMEDDHDTFDPLPPSETVWDGTLTQEQISRVDEAMDRWNREGTQAGRGNEELFELFRSLRSSPLSYQEISYRLYGAARQATSPTDRKRQVDGLLKTIRSRP